MSMTTQEQRIAVAEWAGENKWLIMKHGLYYRPNAHGYTDNVNEAWHVSEADADKHVYRSHDDPVIKLRAPLPDYANDLNAIHEVEKKLDPVMPESVDVYSDTWEKYAGELEYICSNSDPRICAHHATAAQRLEALCRTLWPERFK